MNFNKNVWQQRDDENTNKKIISISANNQVTGLRRVAEDFPGRTSQSGISGMACLVCDAQSICSALFSLALMECLIISMVLILRLILIYTSPMFFSYFISIYILPLFLLFSILYTIQF